MTAYPIPFAALDDRLAILGTAGSGKTYAAGTAVEAILGRGDRVIVIDPLGVWWGLRLYEDGRAPAKIAPVIFGGAHGDLPITEHAGQVVGEAVAGISESCILDLSGIGTKAGERRFMLAFLTALYRTTKGEPVHIIFDEADMWAPQRLLDKEGEAAKLQGMMETIVRRGRVKGFIPWLITQRPAVLSKDVLSQADGLVAFKLTSSQDRDAIGDWVQGQADKDEWKRMWASLPTLQRGNAIVWIPGRGVLASAQFPPKITFDSSRTPKRGEKVKAALLVPLDVGKLRDRLATVETEAKQNDPKALRAEIASLKRQMEEALKRQAVPDPAALDAAREEGKQQAVRAIANLSSGLAASLHDAEEAHAGAKRLLASFGTFMGAMADEKAKPAAPVPKVIAAPVRTVRTEDNAWTGPQRRILNSLAFWHSLGHEAPSREQVALIAEYSPSSSSFANALGALKTAGAIDYPSPGNVTARTFTSDPVAMGIEAAMQLRNMLTGPQRRILDGALQGEADRATIAARAAYSPDSSSFANALGGLRTLGLIDYPSQGRVAVTNWAKELLS
ncbi:ATP-binding protein [Aestuariivirga sp.]|uniref:ATP-binding protein n=1 Tax=Aestuariivirga sp. TaxID=2650926 RepID=UPI0039E375B1